MLSLIFESEPGDSRRASVCFAIWLSATSGRQDPGSVQFYQRAQSCQSSIHHLIWSKDFNQANDRSHEMLMYRVKAVWRD